MDTKKDAAKRRSRRRHDYEVKQRVLAECAVPTASVTRRKGPRMNDQPEIVDPDEDEPGEICPKEEAIRQAAYAAIQDMTTEEYFDFLDKAESFDKFFLLASQYKTSTDPERIAAKQKQREKSERLKRIWMERAARFMVRWEQQQAELAAKAAADAPPKVED